MPAIIEHIDTIARQKKRDVLFIEFYRIDGQNQRRLIGGSEWRGLVTRQNIVCWLDKRGISWTPCGHIANSTLYMSYRGQIYIDIPFDRTLAAYCELESHLEDPDGTPRLPGAMFCCLNYEVAMQNAGHDEPGYWDRWAARF
ncbi:hypothetical protein [Burkholderia contaminans]|uniref:hypothetical protein n=1 Tax=Burkholderia contaminans TaxID=488447 RepID=UPI00158B0A7A|nr:hypothetical protein [Burkholderia contaminans]